MLKYCKLDYTPSNLRVAQEYGSDQNLLIQWILITAFYFIYTYPN